MGRHSRFGDKLLRVSVIRFFCTVQHFKGSADMVGIPVSPYGSVLHYSSWYVYSIGYGRTAVARAQKSTIVIIVLWHIPCPLTL